VAARQGAGEAVVAGCIAEAGDAITFELLDEASERRADPGDLGDMAGGDVPLGANLGRSRHVVCGEPFGGR